MSALSDYLDRLSTPDANGLLPCECGSVATIWRTGSDDEPTHKVQGLHPRCGRSVTGFDRLDAVMTWNSRPLLAALRLAIAQRDNAMMAASVLSDGPFDTTFVDAEIIAKLEGKCRRRS